MFLHLLLTFRIFAESFNSIILKIVQTILLTLFKVWVFLVFTVFMILYLPGILIPFMLGQRFGNIGYFFLWLWSWTFSILTFIRYEFHGREKFIKGKSYIYVSNHTSFLDIPGIRMIFPGRRLIVLGGISRPAPITTIGSIGCCVSMAIRNAPS